MSALSLDEVLERLSTKLKLDPFEAAEWLNLKHRTARITLLVDGARVAPQYNPSAVLIQAAPDGRARLEVVMRGAFKVPLDRVKEFCAEKEWSVERQSFEAEIKAFRRKSGGGRPPKYNREQILMEAFVLVGARGLPDCLSGEGSLAEMIIAALNLPSSATTTVEDILREPFMRSKTERDHVVREREERSKRR